MHQFPQSWENSPPKEVHKCGKLLCLWIPWVYSCILCFLSSLSTWSLWDASSEQRVLPYCREVRHKLIGSCSHQGRWLRGSVCTTVPKLSAWKAREMYLVVTPKTIVFFGPLCCSLMPQLLLCNARSSIKMTAAVSIEMLCSCKGGCLSNVSLVSKNSPGAKLCSSRTDSWTGAALHRWALLAGRIVPLLFGFRHALHANNIISFCHSLSRRTGFLQVVSGPIFFKLCSPQSTGFLMHIKSLSTWCEVFVVTKNTFQYHCHCGFHTEAHNEITVHLSSYIYIRPCFPSHSLTP